MGCVDKALYRLLHNGLHLWISVAENCKFRRTVSDSLRCLISKYMSEQFECPC